MDFNSFNTKTGAEIGAKLHLRHPVLGHYLYSGDGADHLGRWKDKEKSPGAVCVIVRGTESKTVQDRLKQLSTNEMTGDAQKDENRGLDFVCSLVIGFENIERDGEPMLPTEGNKRIFFEQSDSLVEQVIAFARDRTNFFSDAATS
jgi:hypothetical protein